MLTGSDLKKIGTVVETKIVDAIQNVVIPAMDKMEEEIRQDMDKHADQVNDRFNKLEHKADRILARQVDDSSTLKEHEKRMKKMESKSAVV